MNYNLAFDISTTCIGITLFTDEGKLVELKHIKLKSNKTTETQYRYIEKAEIFKNWITNFIEYVKETYKGNIKRVFVEEELFSSNNVKTVNTLIKFNGICSYILFDILKVVPISISVHDIRKNFCPEFVIKKVVKKEFKEILSFPKNIDKKHYIFEKVKKKHPNIEWLYNKNGELIKENYDMSDSVALMYAALKLYF